MSCYTVCDCLLNNLDLDKRYITDLLMVFPQQTNAHKVALDKSNRILGLYEAIAEKNDIIAFWLNLMSMKPTSFITIDVDVSLEKTIEDIFLKVCSATKSEQKAIVNSHEGWVNYSGRVINYNSIPVTVYDKDEAIIDLNQRDQNTTINAENSIIALQGSTIEDSKNINK